MRRLKKEENFAIELTLRIKAVHHRAKEFEFVLNAKIDKVCINENVIRRSQLGVVTEEEAGWLGRPTEQG